MLFLLLALLVFSVHCQTSQCSCFSWDWQAGQAAAEAGKQLGGLRQDGVQQFPCFIALAFLQCQPAQALLASALPGWLTWLVRQSVCLCSPRRYCIQARWTDWQACDIRHTVPHTLMRYTSLNAVTGRIPHISIHISGSKFLSAPFQSSGARACVSILIE